MISVWKSFNSQEPFIGSLLVKFSRLFNAQGHPELMHISIFSPLLPLLKGVSLDTMLGPVPSILGFNNVQLSVNSESHNRMS
jgi:hypothetical protein